MANLLGVEREAIEADPLQAARQVVAELGAVVVMKGSETYVAGPAGTWVYKGGCVGLATSGSGDVLAGVIAGLAARGVSPEEAAVWGVHLHGEAGALLAEKIGPLGFMAREIPDAIPELMARFS
jgi:NAD(P)H-hydrate repair Nnr-like enzyme with NAD(P)H-hydrate dehydratase domain